MSKFAINPNAMPNEAAEERAALDRENAHLHHFDDDGAGENAPVTGSKFPLPPSMFVPDPRYPHGMVDATEAHLAELKKLHAQMAAPAAAPAVEARAESPVAPPACRAQDNPLIVSLIAALPAPDTVWSAADRADWLRAAESLFHLVYKAGEKVDVVAKVA